MKEFKINAYITLKLEGINTNIYLDEHLFQQCKYLAFNFPIDEVHEFDDIQSIDEMEENDRSNTYKELDISPEQEFWGHCSNIHAWVENDYDTRLLHRNLAFPLLKKLTEIGDPVAKRVFKEEIIYRLEEGNDNVVIYLHKEGYLDNFSFEEIKLLSNSVKSPTVKIILQGIYYDLPPAFFNNIDKLMKNIKLTKWVLRNSAPVWYWGSHVDFFNNFDKFKENPELAKWAFQNRVHKVFYDNFNKLKEAPELAKWGFQNNASYEFYEHFEILKDDVELAKWCVQNKLPIKFYQNLSAFRIDPSLINTIRMSKEKKDQFLKHFSTDK
ncbi:MAG: hypothetical protein ACFFBP_08955 [Promethearchaeota archaeon]